MNILLTILLGCFNNNNNNEANNPIIPLPKANEVIVGELAEQYVVIVATAKQPEMPEIPDLPEGFSAQRISSSEYRGLKPCQNVVIADSFTLKHEALAAEILLQKAGISTQVRNTGVYVGENSTLDEYCTQKPPQNSCQDLHFVLNYAGQSWMKLDYSLPQPLSNPKPLEGRQTWITQLSSSQLGNYNKGNTYTVYNPTLGKRLGKASIKSFAALTRGHPHNYYLSLQEDSKPTEPGCGEPEAFAKLSIETITKDPGIALPTNSKPPKLFVPKGPLADVVLEAQAKRVMQESEAFREELGKAQALANIQNEPLQMLVDLELFEGTENLLLIKGVLLTNDGSQLCPPQDVKVNLVAVYDINKENNDRLILGTQKLPFIKINGSVEAILDLNADNSLELMIKSWPDKHTIIGKDLNCQMETTWCQSPC